MLNKIFRWLITIIGLIVGAFISNEIIKAKFFVNMLDVNNNAIGYGLLIFLGIILFGLIFYFLSPLLINIVLKITQRFEMALQNLPTNDIIIAVIGLLTGLLISLLLVGSVSRLLSDISHSTIASLAGVFLAVIFEIIFGTLGVNVALKKKEDLYVLFSVLKKVGKDRKNKGETKVTFGQPKILDTSVIIDGRIFDILKTDFVEGPIIIPSFVLEELRHIADSSDNLKRTRGRRGLDILNQIQRELAIPVEISEKDFENVQEVDSKLLKLAQVMNGKVITNDFNLNKVAEFQGVPVLNINELANAVKPVVIPGETMHIFIVKDGKESGQGIAYLDDGTMIVVEGGKKNLGEEVDIIVTSVLQTAAGRMIFGRIKNAQEKDA